MSPPRGGKKGRKGRGKGSVPGHRVRYRKHRSDPERRSGQARESTSVEGSEPRPHPDTAVTPPAPPARSAPSPRGPGRLVSLDPLAPIIVRSGRPFDDQSGPDPARFPPPSTVAGCLRTAWARENERPFNRELAKIRVEGPLLLTREDKVLVPKPADALYFGHADSGKCVRAQPCAFEHDCDADLPDGLLPVQLTEDVKGKAGPGPAWWSWEDLLDFRAEITLPHDRLCGNGWSPPPGDRRTHVAIDSKTGAAEQGQLFQTEGLDLDAPDTGSAGAAAGGLRFLARCEKQLGETLVHLGGERRLAALQPECGATWPEPPSGWMKRIADVGGLCLTLLTPGIFSRGYRPGWLDPDLAGQPPGAPTLKLKLRAAAVDRWQPHSGWDLANQCPRPTRKLAPAGATYWFTILDGADTNTLDKLWLTSVCDLDQDRIDGFGLVLPSPWTPI